MTQSDIITIDNIEVMISSKEDLIFAKKNIEPIRDKDLLDIDQLEKLIQNEKKNK